MGGNLTNPIVQIEYHQSRIRTTITTTAMIRVVKAIHPKMAHAQSRPSRSFSNHRQNPIESWLQTDEHRHLTARRIQR